jgi:two-component system sensor kinase FixL
MGIGLSVSRTIIEAHAGRIWAENNPTRGATFRFTLPTEEEMLV